jgi:hypothetical protein
MITLKDAIFKALRFYPSLSSPRLLTTTLTQAQIATLEGDRFGFVKRFDNFDTGTPIYILLENPTGSGVSVGFDKRILKTLTAGLEISVFWDYDVSTATKTAIPTYNEHNGYRGIEDGLLEASVLNAVTTDDAGAWTITGAATIADEGIEREPDFIPTAGVGNNSSGGISPEVGFRVYVPGTGALVKLTSFDNDNSVILGYDWIEAPTTL